MITTTSQIYKSLSLHDLNSGRTRAGSCITQNQKDWRSSLNHKHSHSSQEEVQQHLIFHIWACYVLKNNQCCGCSLSSFRPIEIILTHSRKIRNTQLCLVFLNFFSCVKITSVDLKLDRPCYTIGHSYNSLFS